ncbi:DNA-directed RNA polymerase specialized sigma24 family protein [Nonomuraea thailandensis]|uniref:DNA-directed RNA polymerase specialized sigma24 family protein n=1 Tax=Nonomuraea thailandensis TaxID=1188745 RepID=A0A9X2G763_9ACTN|nr:DNA-directed RNA polymerase specialized sigma24 family protein [Nonomuraea thailandensis]
MSTYEEYTSYVRGRLLWLRRIAYALCQDWHRADDLVQASITRLYVKWRHARQADDLDAYVQVILVRVFLKEQRGGWFARTRLSAVPPEAAGGRGTPTWPSICGGRWPWCRHGSGPRWCCASTAI